MTRSDDIFTAFRVLISMIGRDIDDASYITLLRDIAREASDQADSVEANVLCRNYPPGTRIRFRHEVDTGFAVIPHGALATIDSCDANHVHATLDVPIGKVDFCEWDSVEELEDETEKVT